LLFHFAAGAAKPKEVEQMKAELQDLRQQLAEVPELKRQLAEIPKLKKQLADSRSKLILDHLIGAIFPAG